MENRIYQIGNQEYQFTVGSLNEPVVVDDRTGVDVTVTLMPSHQGVEGLQQTLQVAIGAQNTVKVLALTPVPENPGAYHAVFYPTEAVPFTYRIFGTIQKIPVDFIFSCNPDAPSRTAENSTWMTIAEGVIQKYQSGSFACPMAKTNLVFPGAVSSLMKQEEDIQMLKSQILEPEVPIAKLTMTEHLGKTETDFPELSLVLAGISLILSIVCLIKIFFQKSA